MPSMGDFYTASPSALAGQPKKQIADYVEKNGILVPRRFESLDAALSSGSKFIMRSEHPQEYEGASGLLRSFVLSLDDVLRAKKRTDLEGSNPSPKKDVNWYWRRAEQAFASIGDVSQQIVERTLTSVSEPSIWEYCRLLSLDLAEFYKGTSFSYWELLSGYNRSLVADNTLKGRFHLFTTAMEDTGTSSGTYHNYSIIDNGKITFEGPDKLKPALVADLGNIIHFYEKIRLLDKFDPNHCPIIEFQTIGDDHFFLQYHRSRDFRQVDYRLERAPANGEVQATFVRGATTPEGIVVNTAFWYPGFNIFGDEEASYDLHNNSVFSEIMSRRRKVQFMDYTLERIAQRSIDAGHVLKSILFNPEISVALRIDSLFLREEWQGLSEAITTTNSLITVPLKITSDGRVAYIKRMDK